MSLVGLIIILSASAALCSRWGADTVWGGYTKCMIYENTNPKTKINPKAYESITKYNKQGKVTEIISLTPSGLRKKILTMEYDEFGNLIKRNIYSNDKDEVERTIEYVYSK